MGLDCVFFKGVYIRRALFFVFVRFIDVLKDCTRKTVETGGSGHEKEYYFNTEK